MRELLKVVVKKATSQDKTPLSTLYDKIETDIRALGTLKVSTQEMGRFLHPIVESCLTEDVFMAWQRSPLYEKDGSAEKPPRSKLDYLLQFLKDESKREMKREQAQEGFRWETPEVEDPAEKKKRDKKIYKDAGKASSSSVVQSYFCGELSKSYLDEVGIRDTVKIEAQMESDSRVKQEKMDDTASCIVKQPLIAEEIIPSIYGEKEDTIEEVPIEEEKPVVLADIRDTIHTIGVDDQDRNYQKSSWWEGPVWLKQPVEGFPVAVPTNDEDEILVEEDKTTAIAWMHRFIPSFKMKRNPIEAPRAFLLLLRGGWSIPHSALPPRRHPPKIPPNVCVRSKGVMLLLMKVVDFSTGVARISN
ncbi:unnamed protein product [Orchesella dallaii]|uniref:Uncharacterized protein n=1 Tax=Orchesella dallaii TaxID=48710 RepID=A0ABP1S140_9HEXA